MKRTKEDLMQAVFFLTACVSVVSAILICIFLFASGLPAVMKIGWGDFLWGRFGVRGIAFSGFFL